MTLCHSSLYKTTMVLPLHQQGFPSYVVYIMLAYSYYSYGHKYEALQRQRQHTYICTRHTMQNLSSKVMQSYPPRALDRRLQEDWAKDAREGPRVLMSLRVDF